MPSWDRYCIICGRDGSYLDFDPPYGRPATQRCPSHPDEGCGPTVAWLEDDEDRSQSRAGGTESTLYPALGRRANNAGCRGSGTGDVAVNEWAPIPGVEQVKSGRVLNTETAPADTPRRGAHLPCRIAELSR